MEKRRGEKKQSAPPPAATRGAGRRINRFAGLHVPGPLSVLRSRFQYTPPPQPRPAKRPSCRHGSLRCVPAAASMRGRPLPAVHCCGNAAALRARARPPALGGCSRRSAARRCGAASYGGRPAASHPEPVSQPQPQPLPAWAARGRQAWQRWKPSRRGNSHDGKGGCRRWPVTKARGCQALGRLGWGGAHPLTHARPALRTCHLASAPAHA